VYQIYLTWWTMSNHCAVVKNVDFRAGPFVLGFICITSHYVTDIAPVFHYESCVLLMV